MKIKKFIYEKWKGIGSKVRLLWDYVNETSVLDYEESRNDLTKITIKQRFVASMTDYVTMSLFFGTLVYVMLLGFGFRFPLFSIVSLSIAYGLLRHCLRKVFDKEI
jgi:hypothetical protein